MNRNTVQKKGQFGQGYQIPSWHQNAVSEIIGKASLLPDPVLIHVANRINGMIGAGSNMNQSTSTPSTPKTPSRPGKETVVSSGSGKSHKIWEFEILKDLPVFEPLRQNPDKAFRKSEEGLRLLSMISAASGAIARGTKAKKLSNDEVTRTLSGFHTKKEFQEVYLDQEVPVQSSGDSDTALTKMDDTSKGESSMSSAGSGTMTMAVHTQKDNSPQVHFGNFTSVVQSKFTDQNVGSTLQLPLPPLPTSMQMHKGKKGEVATIVAMDVDSEDPEGFKEHKSKHKKRKTELENK